MGKNDNDFLLEHEEALHELLAWSALVKCAASAMRHDEAPWNMAEGIELAGRRVMEIAEGMM